MKNTPTYVFVLLTLSNLFGWLIFTLHMLQDLKPSAMMQGTIYIYALLFFDAITFFDWVVRRNKERKNKEPEYDFTKGVRGKYVERYREEYMSTRTPIL